MMCMSPPVKYVPQMRVARRAFHLDAPHAHAVVFQQLHGRFDLSWRAELSQSDARVQANTRRFIGQELGNFRCCILLFCIAQHACGSSSNFGLLVCQQGDKGLRQGENLCFRVVLS